MKTDPGAFAIAAPCLLQQQRHQLRLRMLLRMLSACAPGIGYLINPTACSGQDQDPSNETIVECSTDVCPRSVRFVASTKHQRQHGASSELQPDCASATLPLFLILLVAMSQPFLDGRTWKKRAMIPTNLMGKRKLPLRAKASSGKR